MAEDTETRDELSALALNLAAYLSEADQVTRLLMLFNDDRWLIRRFDPEVRSWDGYQQDLESAWDALDRTLSTSGPPATDPMPDLVRLALGRATLSSADDIPPVLMLAALSSGQWTVERAVSTIGRHPSPERRAAMFYELLRTPQLDSSVRRTIQSQLVELAQLPSRYLPADALLAGLELLNSAERITVTDRIAADAIVTGGSLPPSELSGPNISAAAAVQAFEVIPETRRPVLVAKVADALLIRQL